MKNHSQGMNYNLMNMRQIHIFFPKYDIMELSHTHLAVSVSKYLPTFCTLFSLKIFTTLIMLTWNHNRYTQIVSFPYECEQYQYECSNLALFGIACHTVDT